MDRQREFLGELEDGMKSDPHVFTPEELAGCSENGECCQCGLCCIALETDVPAQKPLSVTQNVDTVRKESLQVCPFLKDDGTGRFGCACHDVKDHPELVNCNTWKGNGVHPKRVQGTDYEFLNKREVMLKVYISRLLSDGTPADIAIAEKMAEKGALQDFETSGWGNVWNKVVARFINQTLSPEWPLEGLPVHLFRLLKIEDLIERYVQEQGLVDLFFALDLSDANNLRVVEFHRKYILPYYQGGAGGL